MSHTNLKTINSVEINNSGPFRVGDQLTSGTTGQVLKSLGDSLSPEWSNDTDTTYQGSTTINIDTTTDPDTINVLKVPNALTFTGTDTGTFDGSSALSINLTDTDTTYQGSSTINIDTTTDPDTINVLKVPNTLTAGTNITYNSGTTYDGSTAITISATDTDTTYQGSSTINIDTTTDPDTINVLKVPNVLTAGTNITYNSGTTYDGSTAITISATDTDTTYTAGNGIQISGSNIIQTKTDNQTIRDSGGGSGNNLEVIKVPNTLTFTGTDTGTFDGSSALSINLTDTDTTYQGSSTINIDTTTNPDTINALKVPNVLTAGTNITYNSGTTYDGSTAITISATDTNTTYQGGTNISIDTSTTPDSINLDASIMNQTLLLFNQTGITTAIIGSAYPNTPTTASYLDLSSATNTIPGGVLATKIQQTYMRRDIGTTYIEYSSNFRTSFVAQSATAMVEFYAVIAAYSSKLFYGALYDYINSQFFATSQTQHRFKFDNGLDQDPTSCMWYLTGLTAGTTYYISPYFKSSTTTSYIYAGNSGAANSFAPGILRIIDGGNNVGIY